MLKLGLRMELLDVNRLMRKVEKDFIENRLTLREFEERHDVLWAKKSELERKLAAV